MQRLRRSDDACTRASMVGRDTKMVVGRWTECFARRCHVSRTTSNGLERGPADPTSLVKILLILTITFYGKSVSGSSVSTAIITHDGDDTCVFSFLVISHSSLIISERVRRFDQVHICIELVRPPHPVRSVSTANTTRTNPRRNHRSLRCP